jgi:transposase
MLLANGETDAKSLALLGDDRLKCTEEQLVEALTGRLHPMHGQMLALQLERLRLLDEQIAKLNSLIAQAMKPHQDAVIRLAEVPGLGIDSAQQVIAEVGVTASTFSSAAEFTSWVGTCPGKEESAEENSSSRSAKGNKYMRRVLNQAAHAAARSKGTHFRFAVRGQRCVALGRESSWRTGLSVPAIVAVVGLVVEGGRLRPQNKSLPCSR